MSQNNAHPSADRITHAVELYTRKQNFMFPAYSLIEVHQLLKACRQIEAREKPICMRWKTHQCIVWLIKKLEKNEKNSGFNYSQLYEKIDDPQTVFTAQLLESALPTDGFVGKIQMFALRWRYSFAYCAFITCLLSPKNIYKHWRQERQLKRNIQQLDAEINAWEKIIKN
jgi:hypothetical protein